MAKSPGSLSPEDFKGNNDHVQKGTAFVALGMEGIYKHGKIDKLGNKNKQNLIHTYNMIPIKQGTPQNHPRTVYIKGTLLLRRPNFILQ